MVSLPGRARSDGFVAAPRGVRVRGDGDFGASSLVTRLWRRVPKDVIAVVAVVVSSSGIGGALIAGWMEDDARFEAVVYVTQEAQSELFYADEFGVISPELSQSRDLVTGANTLRFGIDPGLASSWVQRFDPCVCDSPVLVDRIALVSGFTSSRVSPALWGPAGDVVAIDYEGSSARIVTAAAGNDPQIFLYLDVQAFLDRARVVNFFVVFGLLAAALFILIGLAAIAHAWASPRVTRSVLVGHRRVLRSSDAPVPLYLVLIAMLVVALGVGQVIFGALVSGVTLDEPAHVRHLSNYFDTGRYSSVAYGPVTSLVGHAANVALGFEVWGIPVATAEAYQIRHLVVGLIGLVGVAAVAYIGWLTFSSGRWAAVAAAVLLSMPLWVGHSMFNLKDVPLASGYTLFTAALITLFHQRFPVPMRWLITLLLAALGAGIALGTRPGAAPFFVVSVGIAVVMWFFLRASRVPAIWRLVSLTSLAGVGLVGLWWFARFTERGQELVLAVERSIDFPWSGFNTYAGERVYGRPGVDGLTMIFASYLPVGMVALILAGVVTGIVALVLKMRGRGSSNSLIHSYLLVTTQALVAFVVVGVFDPVVYDGGRQLLFVFPALAVLATIGVYGLLKIAPLAVASATLARRASVALVGGMLIVVSVEQVRLFPYNYSYFNVIAQGPGVSGQWDTDYWFQSSKEVSRLVASGDPVNCGEPWDLIAPIENQSGPCEPVAPFTGAGAQSGVSILGERQFWAVRHERGLLLNGPVFVDNCQYHSSISRPLRGETVTMSRLYLCVDR